MSVASSPVDVIKSRYMNDHGGAYRNVVHCIVKTLREEGVRAFYKGFWPNYFRLGGHCFLVCEIKKKTTTQKMVDIAHV